MMPLIINLKFFIVRGTVKDQRRGFGTIETVNLRAKNSSKDEPIQ